MSFEFSIRSDCFDADTSGIPSVMVEAEKDGVYLEFEKQFYTEDEFDLFVLRPAEYRTSDFIDDMSDDPKVLPDSDIGVVETRDQTDDPRETTFALYSIWDEENREDKISTSVALTQNKNEVVSWVNLEKHPREEVFRTGETVYGNGIVYKAGEPDTDSMKRYIAGDSLTEEKLSDLWEEAEKLMEKEGF